MQVLTGATLIDGTGRIPVSDVTVVLNDAGRIEEVGPRAAITIPPGATTYDVTGLTLMPGLIDCHDHLSSHGTSLAERFALAEPISTGHVRTAKVLEQVLRTGYTTVRDGGWLDVGFKQAIEQKLINRALASCWPPAPSHPSAGWPIGCPRPATPACNPTATSTPTCQMGWLQARTRCAARCARWCEQGPTW